jgi:hypothetical protein
VPSQSGWSEHQRVDARLRRKRARSSRSSRLSPGGPLVEHQHGGLERPAPTKADEPRGGRRPRRGDSARAQRCSVPPLEFCHRPTNDILVLTSWSNPRARTILDARGRSPIVRSSSQPTVRPRSRGSLPRLPYRDEAPAIRNCVCARGRYPLTALVGETTNEICCTSDAARSKPRASLAEAMQ